MKHLFNRLFRVFTLKSKVFILLTFFSVPASYFIPKLLKIKDTYSLSLSFLSVLSCFTVLYILDLVTTTIYSMIGKYKIQTAQFKVIDTTKDILTISASLFIINKTTHDSYIKAIKINDNVINSKKYSEIIKKDNETKITISSFQINRMKAEGIKSHNVEVILTNNKCLKINKVHLI